MWLYKESFDIKDWFGFVYIIENLKTGKKYIGKKFFLSKTNKKLGKKELAALPVQAGRKPSKKLVIQESNWQDYYGSNDILKKDVEKYGKENFKREILRLCKSKKELTYYETKFQFIYEVLEHSDKWYNTNIAGTHFAKDFE